MVAAVVIFNQHLVIDGHAEAGFAFLAASMYGCDLILGREHLIVQLCVDLKCGSATQVTEWWEKLIDIEPASS